MAKLLGQSDKYHDSACLKKY